MCFNFSVKLFISATILDRGYPLHLLEYTGSCRKIHFWNRRGIIRDHSGEKYNSWIINLSVEYPGIFNFFPGKDYFPGYVLFEDTYGVTRGVVKWFTE